MSIATQIRSWPAMLFLLLAACGGGDRMGALDTGATPPPATPPPGANRPPEISGTPPNVATVGQRWLFQPSISDPDGSGVTVSATNLPGWITLYPSTGRMQGTPAEEDVRTWSNIRLTVSDGQASATLPAFSLTVVSQGAAMGTVTLSWAPPTQRTDGSPIGALAGYRLLYGQVSRDYDHTIRIDNPGVTRYVVERLGPGTWYFAVQAVDSDGLVSEPSAEASRTF